MACELDAVDLIRQRMGVGYSQAAEALRANDGDVVSALAQIEDSLAQSETDLGALIRDISEEVGRAYQSVRISEVEVRLGDNEVARASVDLRGAGAAALTLAVLLLDNLEIDLTRSGEVTCTSITTGDTSTATDEVT